MNIPTPCPSCNCIVDLNSMKESCNHGDFFMVCPDCYVVDGLSTDSVNNPVNESVSINELTN